MIEEKIKNGKTEDEKMKTTESMSFKEMVCLGKVEFLHSTSSGKEIVCFYSDAVQSRLYHDVHFFDSYDGSETKKYGACPLPREEIQRLVSLGTVTDYRRFYFG